MTTFFQKYKKQLLGIGGMTALIALLILANFLSSFLITTQSTPQTISSQPFEFYLISLSKSQLQQEAKSHAKDFQALGAGGFIWQDDEYHHIISSGYLNKADAELVQSSIKLNQNLDSQLLTVKFNSYSISGNFSNDEIKVITNLLNACLNFYTSIYDIAISLDTGVSNEVGAKLAINASHNNFATTLSNFNTIYPKPHPSHLAPLYNMATKAYQVGEKLCRGEKVTDSQNYSSTLKYRYLEIMKLYYDFCK